MNYETQSLLVTALAAFSILIGISLAVYVVFKFVHKEYKEISSLRKLKDMGNKVEVITYDKNGIPRLIKIDNVLKYL